MISDEVLAFWFLGERDTFRAVWFRKDNAFDGEIRARFGAATEAARTGAFAAWAATAPGTLALLILLDQFPRNLYRGSPLAFASDARARDVARAGLRHAAALTPTERSFLYLPFEHSENLYDQDVSVHLFGTMAGEPGMASTFDYAERHRAVIRRFGRFPHRNAALGRVNTSEEAEYLAQPGAGF